MTERLTIPHDKLERIRALIESADGLLITAGAGMGVDSGLPDFRGNEGMWRHYPALAKLRMGFSSIANPQAFRKTPELAWGFYGHRLQMYRQTRPHAGFALLKQLAERFEQGYFVFTSNVDGQFQKAGFLTERIHECHGSIHALQCMEPGECSPSVWQNITEPVIDNDWGEMISPLPKCQHCGGLARPNILMFDDWHWQEWPYIQQRQRLEHWLRQCKAPVVVEIGAGLAIPTVQYFSDSVSNNGERLIRINPTQAGIAGKRGVSLALTGLAGITLLAEAAGLDVASA